ncbi:hypothetical protein CFP56_032551 [Quercus suber]|uniref:Uncharacterized protein n=1 Tax=Quercus suber TaxID=58331 RepID=A0AAW0LUY7_QUESU
MTSNVKELQNLIGLNHIWGSPTFDEGSLTGHSSRDPLLDSLILQLSSVCRLSLSGIEAGSACVKRSSVPTSPCVGNGLAVELIVGAR